MENLLTMASSFPYLSKPLQIVSVRYKLLQIIQTSVALSFFFLRILFSLLSSRTPQKTRIVADEHQISGSGDSGVARALSQMLSIVHEIPVSSRKYETLRSLAEKVMDENVKEESADVNRAVLSSAFEMALARLERLMWWRAEEPRDALWLVRPVGWVFRAVAGSEVGSGSGSPEKIAAELLWMARKMVECGAGEEAVYVWGSASSLGSMAVAAEPALQGSLVKLSGICFSHERTVCFYYCFKNQTGQLVPKPKALASVRSTTKPFEETISIKLLEKTSHEIHSILKLFLFKL